MSWPAARIFRAISSEASLDRDGLPQGDGNHAEQKSRRATVATQHQHDADTALSAEAARTSAVASAEICGG